MRTARSSLLRELFSPLSLAALLAIVVVWYTGVEALAARTPAFAWPARTAIVLFLGGFLAVMWPGSRPLRYYGAVTVMLASAFALLWLGPAGSTSILLVLLSAVLAAQLNARELGLALLIVNLALLATMRWRWGMAWGSAVANGAGVASFQIFAALVMRYAMRAEAMAEELRDLNADLLATRSLLAQSARDGERLRLSRELHDVAGHKLTALKLNLAALAREPRLAGVEAVPLCAQLADELLADIRGVVQQMRQGEGMDLRTGLMALAAPFPRPALQLQLDDDARVADLAQAEALLRTVQEALTNAARHSQADRLWVVLRRERGELVLDIRDDGRGHGELRFGNGLSGMRERLRALGGELQAERNPAGGVQLLARLPVAA